MKIAIPEYMGRVSPVFDTCQRLLVFTSGKEGKALCQSEDWSGVDRVHRPSRLRDIGVETLLCGGISSWMEEQIVAQGIKLVPWLAGEINEVLDAFLAGLLPNPGFFMPGCCGKRRRQRIGWRHR